MADKGVNKATILGHLGKDPEVRYSPSGTAFAKFSLATSESWNDKNTGEKREQTEWHNIVIQGKLAEVAGEYLRKGSQVYIEGKIKTRKYQGNDGQDKYITEIVVGINGSMQMLGGNGGGGNQAGSQRAPQLQRQPQQQATSYNEPPMNFDEEPIPF